MTIKNSTKTFTIEKKFGISFEEAMNRQIEKINDFKKNRNTVGLLLLVEHTPIITMGRTGNEDNLLADKNDLKKNGIAYHPTRRGGDITYHGPGQITLYPVFPLEWYWRDLHKYMRTLEEVGINYLSCKSIQGCRKEGLTGVWVNNEKIAAIGISVSNWITYFGMAININPKMEHFSLIKPCGITEYSVTSLHKITNKDYSINNEMDSIVECFCNTFKDTKIVKD